jgi:hypothetical protein
MQSRPYLDGMSPNTAKKALFQKRMCYTRPHEHLLRITTPIFETRRHSYRICKG